MAGRAQRFASMLKMEASALLGSVGGLGLGLSREFLELVRDIGECKSKQEEDRLMEGEVKRLRGLLAGSSSLSNRGLRELMIRCIYCEMLGHSVLFAYIHAINLTQNPHLGNKRAGYLFASLHIDEANPLTILLINSLSRDLASGSVVNICCALTCIAKLCSHESLPVLLPLVFQCWDHTHALVRKKAVCAFLSALKCDHSLLDCNVDKLRRALCDADPAVMHASLNIFQYALQHRLLAAKDLVPSFASILKQTVDRRLGMHYDVHGIPAPHTQLSLLKILALLGKDDKEASEHMIRVTEQCLKQAETSTNPMGKAILYECVCCVTAIYPNPLLLDQCAKAVRVLLEDAHYNVKYMGLTALSRVVQIDARYARQHQQVLINCMDDADGSIRTKTLRLLALITNRKNADLIVQKMMHNLAHTHGADERRELVGVIVHVASQFYPTAKWYLATMMALLACAGESLAEDAVPRMIVKISQDLFSSQAERAMLCKFLLDLCYMLVHQKKEAGQPHSDNALQLMSWVFSNLSGFDPVRGPPAAAAVLCGFVHQPDVAPASLLCILSALTKLFPQVPVDAVRADILGIFEKNTKSKEPCVRALCHEAIALAHYADSVTGWVSAFYSFTDFTTPKNLDLPLLAKFLTAAKNSGASPYIPPADRPPEWSIHYDEHDLPFTGTVLKYEAYQPTAPAPNSIIPDSLFSPSAEVTSTLASAGRDALPTPPHATPSAATSKDAGATSSGVRFSLGPRGRTGRWGRMGPGAAAGDAGQQEGERTPASAATATYTLPSAGGGEGLVRMMLDPMPDPQGLAPKDTAPATKRGMGKKARPKNTAEKTGRPASKGTAKKVSGKGKAGEKAAAAESGAAALPLVDLLS